MKTAEALELTTEDPRVIVREMTTVEDDRAFWEALEANRAHLSQHDDQLGSAFWTRREVTEHRTGKPSDKMLAIWNEQVFAGSVSVAWDGEVGYWLREDQLHQGLATMAVRSVVEYYGDRRGALYANVNRRNQSSLRVMSRLEAPRTGQFISGGVYWRQFDLGGIDRLLGPGEHAILYGPEPDTLEQRYGYDWAPISQDSDPDEITGSVVYTVEPHGATPPTLVTAGGVQTLSVLRGSGLLAYCNGDTKEFELSEFDQADGGIDIWRGDGLYLLNHPHAGRPLIVRHDGLPAAEDGLVQTTQIIDVTLPHRQVAALQSDSGLPAEFFRLARPSA